MPHVVARRLWHARQVRALTTDSLGAWLVKASPDESSVEELVRRGFATTWSWCVRPTYRADLVVEGQPVLVWVSGDGRRVPAGLHAQGVTTGPVGPDHTMPVTLEPVDPPVPRAALLDHPLLSRAEVVRMPAGSNPSYLTVEQLAVLREEFPQLRR